eukprot:scaffold347_cov239-Pinguiococcus_pyrenoidosus.AAC.9
MSHSALKACAGGDAAAPSSPTFFASCSRIFRTSEPIAPSLGCNVCASLTSLNAEARSPRCSSATALRYSAFARSGRWNPSGAPITSSSASEHSSAASWKSSSLSEHAATFSLKLAASCAWCNEQQGCGYEVSSSCCFVAETKSEGLQASHPSLGPLKPPFPRAEHLPALRISGIWGARRWLTGRSAWPGRSCLRGRPRCPPLSSPRRSWRRAGQDPMCGVESSKDQPRSVCPAGNGGTETKVQ